MEIVTKKQVFTITREIRSNYSAYKIGDIAVHLYLYGVKQENIDYILDGGKQIKMQPYSVLQEYLDKVMNRMDERLPHQLAVKIRRGSACCLTGKRDTLAKAIYANNPTIEERFKTLSKERNIIGGKGWKENDDYFISYWCDKPEGGYVCPCLKYKPIKPMNKLWCECCVGHIKHHFDTALGVDSTCECVSSILTSCGELPCVFKFNIKND